MKGRACSGMNAKANTASAPNKHDTTKGCSFAWMRWGSFAFAERCRASSGSSTTSARVQNPQSGTGDQSSTVREPWAPRPSQADATVHASRIEAARKNA